MKQKKKRNRQQMCSAMQSNTTRLDAVILKQVKYYSLCTNSYSSFIFARSLCIQYFSAIQCALSLQLETSTSIVSVCWCCSFVAFFWFSKVRLYEWLWNSLTYLTLFKMINELFKCCMWFDLNLIRWRRFNDSNKWQNAFIMRQP